MPAASLLTLLDDIVYVLDDVATMTKVAASKTAGVIGDDLALNAQQVAGVRAERELPVIWKVAKGSLLNKLILVPAAMLISVFLPWLIKPLLMVGGAYLCFEGVEKLYHRFFEKHEDSPGQAEPAVSETTESAQLEKEKIRGAIRTDFVLSAEIIVIALGSVAGSSVVVRLGVLSIVALLMTIGVYGFVAAIIKFDDLGLYLIKRQKGRFSSLSRLAGKALLLAAPVLLRILSVVGTLAMFLVGGGIIVHGIPVLGSFLHHYPIVFSSVLTVLAGVVMGAVVLLVAKLVRRVRLLSA